ncbi:amino acid adenylation domain-containing protein [Clostridium tagluense]|uniref:non-ribosomal peptide synthetase n=1 Tax=Clostridium tagluense TaxID=360422 RepID=UPI001CF3CB92|nr:non-ribosomal peptide synthetase [Clostridium tagluense]MCB2311578.1 amino acid adenylation domain-containing protein [Clostridium tagluense]MCB2316302.1 amino acid adenylation domain-containing protein [Clostridium tagluense]MCB2321156.1 amino acid adenylation domain-containing protein [Clostridium tagluense]MCB2326171.1 amino acid adenylation domain-containing protein [Clostridium tagluense]MCB2330894.1 amino acid adenylation domain-containing protein [Clostridium tagluense]
MKEEKIIIDSLKEIKEAKEYWINTCLKPMGKLLFPRDFFGDFQYDKAKFNFVLSGNLYNKLNDITNGENLTIYTLLLSVFKIELFKYTMQNDLIIGIPVYFKSNQEDSLNKVVLTRDYLEDNMTFKQVLLYFRKTLIETYKNQIVSLEETIKLMNVDNDIMSLLPINFAMKNIHNEEHIEYIVNSPKNEITFLIEKVNNTILFEVIFNSKLFKTDTIQRFCDIYLNILYQVLNNLEVRLYEIEMLSEGEKHKLLYDFNNTCIDYPRDKMIHELFEERAEKTPDNVAVVFEDKKLTYRELNEKANRLARNLREKGVKPDSIVGIMVERSLEMIVGIMAILKAGGAYLPIDPNYPEDRINYMIDDSKTNIILTQSNFINKVVFNGVIIDLKDEDAYVQDIKNLDHINEQKDLAYIIYTSGTTGKPKGTMIEHKNVVRLMFNDRMKFDFNEKDVWTMFHSYCFDFSVWEMYGALLYGGKLILISKNKARDTDEYLNILKEEKVTVLNQIPTPFYNLMNKELDSGNNELKLRYVIFGGEALKPEMLRSWMKKYPKTRLINMYGITETTVHVTFKEIKEDDINLKISNVGKPLPTVSTYIMDKNLKLQPIGVSGELCVGGEGVARGYLNREKLTEEKFVTNPYKAEEKIYRSGDLARMLYNGEIEYLGRIDHQVKIRGFRIELAEIENQLVNYEQIKEAVVIDREDKNGDKYLCAYIVAREEVTVGELRKHLLKALPEYMVPSYFIQLEKIPLTSNGKIDRHALPEPDGNIATGTAYEGARNEREETLVKIWSEVLGVENIGINHNFFDLGGHSLKATILISKIHKELNVEVPLKEIFKSPTIKGISEYIQITEKNIYEEIKIVKEKEYYEVSSAQKRMYILQQFELQSISYNMPGVMEVEGNLDVQKLEIVFNKLIKRHETLRTSFENIEGEIVQKISSDIDFKVGYVDIRKTIEEVALDKEIINLDNYHYEKVVNEEIEKLISSFVSAFDLSKTSLLRVGVIKTHEAKQIIMVDMHHIISDGVSMGILTKEFVDLYDGKELEKIKVQYKDFSAWQNTLLKSKKIKKQEEYWLQSFSDEIPVLNMPTDFQRPALQSFEGDSISFKLDKDLTSDLKKLAKETGSTMYMVLLSGVNILLSKYSGQEDIIVGSPIAGRPHADLEKIIGIFVNTLAMRNHAEGSRTYEDFLKEVKENALKAYENQDYQFDELVDKLSITRDISRNPLFDVMFTMQNLDSEDVELKDLIFKGYKQENKIAKFDLTFSASEVKEEVIFELQYSTKLYKRETIERMVEHFVNIIKEITRNINIKLSEIEMITEEEKYKLLYEFNDTYADYPRDKTIHELFEEQVEKTPDNVAVVFEDKELTYRELNERANKLARTLREKGVKADSIVGIMVERSFEMIVGIMGVLKAGGAYLPINPEYPVDRIKYMIEDSKLEILLIQSKLKEKTTFKGELLDLEDEKYYEGIGQNLDVVNSSRDLAYIIYTSGSTGKPKGVMIEQLGVVNLSYWYGDRYNLKENSNMLQSTNISFDASIEETIVVLLNGATMYIPPKYNIIDKEKFLQYVNEKNINIVQLVPATLKELIAENDYMKSLSLIICGGEKMNENIRNMVIEKGYNLYDHYGPTETTVVSITTKCNINESTIGKPLQNNQIAIINKNKNMQPIGVPGELCILGDGLARGYLNRTQLTAEKFINNPFISEKRMYKTGDLARWMPDGNIEFLGRIDHQVKIRGFRIELGEIESQLLNHKSIKEAIVLDKEDENGSKYLCAYFVSEKELTVGELRTYLSKNLPEYMIPSYFVQLDKMPLTPNGKIDRKALPKPDGSIVTGAEYEVARNEVEEKLVAIWRDVLAAERIGINDNFFELGGHSLKATTLVLKIHKELNVAVPLREIFKSPTIKGTSEYIESTEKSIYSSIEIVEEKEYYEASSAQKRMYLLQQFDLDSTGYNMPGVMLIDGRVEAERLEKSFALLIRRHETLRTSFETIEDKIIQRVDGSVNFKLDRFEVGFIESTDKAVDSIVRDFVKAFDLNKAPLLRVGLIKLEEEKYILMFDMHHIISDGVSMGILINEFVKIYEENELELLRIQYKDYSQWQNSLLKSDLMREQKEYWIDRFSNEIPVLNIPTDFIRPTIQSFEGDSISFKLNRELTKDLKRISKETGSTMYMVLLSGVNILLSKYSGQEDIIVGSPIAGRPHADLEKIIGIFVNTLAMRNYPEGSRTYEDFLKEVKENALKAYENQDYQFDELIDKLSIPRDISRNPLFDVMFTMDNMDSEEFRLKDLVLKGYKQEHKVAKFDLTFSASEVGDEIIFELEYSKKLYKIETIERMVEHFINVIKVITGDKKIKLSEIEMLTEDEKHKLLFEFNDTYAEYPRDKTIHELFEEQVEKTPDNIAVVFEDKELTYRELNEKANRLARTLREKGVKPDSIVGIMVERSADSIVGIMGVLKAGGAYLPIDQEYPEERIKYMLQHSKTNILLTQSKFMGELNFLGQLINLEDEKSYANSLDNLENISASTDLAYVIYTSGSTGKPKGVMIEQKSVVNLCNWCNKKYNIEVNKNALQITNISFDVSVEETIGMILNGGTIYIPHKDIIFDKNKFKNYVNKNKINLVQFVPATLNELIAENDFMESLSVIICGGDKLENTLKNKVMSKGYSLYNNYGPTEITVDAINTKCSESNVIGKPIDNTQIYILNNAGLLQPTGIAGEICVSGEGVARGYLNTSELTAEKFIDNPFNVAQKMYKTGDLGAWTPDGNIEFLGRIDHQVKIRGFRIELGEIESQLLTNEVIKETIVIDRQDINGIKYLCAYIVSEKELIIGELRKHLSNSLPQYMIPSYFVQLEKMPLTPNGKTDRKSLPEPDGSIVTGTEYEAPRNEVEEKLVEIWKEILGVGKVGINDSFFELGGHSLKATTLTAKIHKEFNIEVPLKQIFSTPTIKGVGEYVEKSGKNLYVAIEKIEEREYYTASSVQKQLYILQQFDIENTVYNMPCVMELEGKVEKSKVENVFTKLVERHEAIRTSFKLIDEEIVQKIHDKVDFNINYVECTEKFSECAIVIDENTKIGNKNIEDVDSNNNEYDIEGFIGEFIKPFDLNKAPLLRVTLVKLADERHLLMIDMHHIIGDGVSINILTREFIKLYKGVKLPKLRIQYKDYSEWQSSIINVQNLIKQEKFWLNEFKGNIPILNLPINYTRSAIQSFHGDNVEFCLDRELIIKIKEVTQKTNATIFMVLFATYNILLSKYSGQEDIIVGSPIANRTHSDLQNIIGMFVNTVAIRSYPKRNKTFEEFLIEIKNTLFKIYDNQNYPFEQLIDKLRLKRDMSRNPLFDVMFDINNTNSIKYGEFIKGLKITPYDFESNTSKFDMTLSAVESNNNIEMNIEYCTNLFKKETIIKMKEHYIKILEIVMDNPNTQIKDIKIQYDLVFANSENDNDVDFCF